MLSLRAEFAGWELARVLRFPDGTRRVWLRRRRDLGAAARSDSLSGGHRPAPRRLTSSARPDGYRSGVSDDDQARQQTRRDLLANSLGVGAASGAYAVSFGAIAIASGLDVWQTMALSVLMFTGGQPVRPGRGARRRRQPDGRRRHRTAARVAQRPLRAAPRPAARPARLAQGGGRTADHRRVQRRCRWAGRASGGPARLLRHRAVGVRVLESRHARRRPRRIGAVRSRCAGAGRRGPGRLHRAARRRGCAGARPGRSPRCRPPVAVATTPLVPTGHPGADRRRGLRRSSCSPAAAGSPAPDGTRHDLAGHRPRLRRLLRLQTRGYLRAGVGSDPRRPSGEWPRCSRWRCWPP